MEDTKMGTPGVPVNNDFVPALAHSQLVADAHESFAMARQDMMFWYRAWVQSKPPGTTVLSEIVATAAVMEHLVEMEAAHV